MTHYNKQPKSLLFPLPLLLMTFTLSGCIDLSVTRSNYRKDMPNYAKEEAAPANNKKGKQIKTVAAKKGEVYTMLGGLGLFSIGMYQLRDSVMDQYKYEVPAQTTMWYNAGAESREIINAYYKEKVHKPIILMGHSLGANEQIKVARNLNAAGVPVDLLVTIDAVSQSIVPPNVKLAVNMYKPGYVPMFSGLKLKAVDPAKTKIENINVETLKNVNVNHFTIDKNKIVQAMIMGKVEKVLADGNKKGA